MVDLRAFGMHNDNISYVHFTRRVYYNNYVHLKNIRIVVHGQNTTVYHNVIKRDADVTIIVIKY